jgi:hypothetical protein
MLVPAERGEREGLLCGAEKKEQGRNGMDGRENRKR